MAAAFPAEVSPAAGALPEVFPVEEAADAPAVLAEGGPAAVLGLDRGPAASALALAASGQDRSLSITRPGMAAEAAQAAAETATVKRKLAAGLCF